VRGNERKKGGGSKKNSKHRLVKRQTCTPVRLQGRGGGERYQHAWEVQEDKREKVEGSKERDQ